MAKGIFAIQPRRSCAEDTSSWVYWDVHVGLPDAALWNEPISTGTGVGVISSRNISPYCMLTHWALVWLSSRGFIMTGTVPGGTSTGSGWAPEKTWDVRWTGPEAVSGKLLLTVTHQTVNWRLGQSSAWSKQNFLKSGILSVTQHK